LRARASQHHVTASPIEGAAKSGAAGFHTQPSAVKMPRVTVDVRTTAVPTLYRSELA
jgi:hypothetical protein